LLTSGEAFAQVEVAALGDLEEVILGQPDPGIGRFGDLAQELGGLRFQHRPGAAGGLLAIGLECGRHRGAKLELPALLVDLLPELFCILQPGASRGDRLRLGRCLAACLLQRLARVVQLVSESIALGAHLLLGARLGRYLVGALAQLLGLFGGLLNLFALCLHLLFEQRGACGLVADDR
jgi:hypothetical protein